jgi:hypothetical protein
MILNAIDLYEKFTNEWEITFMKGIRDMPYRLTHKQFDILQQIIKKYKYLIPPSI